MQTMYMSSPLAQGEIRFMTPEEAGWIHDTVGITGSDTGCAYILPDGSFYEFPPHGPRIIVEGPELLLCPPEGDVKWTSEVKRT